MTSTQLKVKQNFNRRDWSDFRRMGRIAECFYLDKTTVSGDIKQSHSLQRNGRLSLIEGDDGKGNQVVYTFANTEVDENFGFASTTHSNRRSPYRNN